jgi:hypothetical protein
MNYNAKNLKAMLDSGDIDKTRWKIYFASVPDTVVPTCRDCMNKKNGTCSEIGDPVECFLYGSLSKSDGFLLKGSKIQ